MSHLETAHKLGALAAIDDFTAWLQNDDGNPTDYPKRRGAILKTAQGNPMQPNPGVIPPAPQPMPVGGTGGAVGGPVQGTGAAPMTPPPNVKGASVRNAIDHVKVAIVGGGTRQAQDLAREGILPTKPPKPVPRPAPKPTAALPGGMVATAADRAVEQVMRKLGKSMSRRPLSRDGTKYEALKKKLRKQKLKKA